MGHEILSRHEEKTVRLAVKFTFEINGQSYERTVTMPVPFFDGVVDEDYIQLSISNRYESELRELESELNPEE